MKSASVLIISIAIAASLSAMTANPSAAGNRAETSQPRPLPIRVMSFNIRYGTADDGENHWDKRHQFLTETIRAFNPDLLGTQETLKFQRDYLATQFPEYDVLGVGRNDGRDEGEMTALYYRRDRFEKLAEGHFWLSSTPEVIGSQGWDAALPRMVSWVRLRDRQNPAAPPIAFFNTHFDHKGLEARRESAALIRRQIGTIGKDCSVIVTGDFNAGEGSAPYTALFATADRDSEASPVRDSYRVVHPAREANEGTFSGFLSAVTAGERIDWIAISPDWSVSEAAIDRTARDGRTPSDHFPVTAVLNRPGSSGPDQ